MAGKANIVKLGAARKRASSPETAEELARLASSVAAFEADALAARTDEERPAVQVTSLSELSSRRSGLALKRQEPASGVAGETVEFRKKPAP